MKIYLKKTPTSRHKSFTRKKRVFRKRLTRKRLTRKKSGRKRASRRKSKRQIRRRGGMKRPQPLSPAPPVGGAAGGVATPKSKKPSLQHSSPLINPDQEEATDDSGDNLLFKVEVETDADIMYRSLVDLKNSEAVFLQVPVEDITKVKHIYIQNSKCCVQLNLLYVPLSDEDDEFVEYITVAFLFKKSRSGGGDDSAPPVGGAAAPDVQNYISPLDFSRRNGEALDAMGVTPATSMKVKAPIVDNLWNVDWDAASLHPSLPAESWTAEGQDINLSCINFLFICLFMIIKSISKNDNYQGVDIELSAACPKEIYEAIGFVEADDY